MILFVNAPQKPATTRPGRRPPALFRLGLPHVQAPQLRRARCRLRRLQRRGAPVGVPLRVQEEQGHD